jgi:hypothetical protein
MSRTSTYLLSLTIAGALEAGCASKESGPEHPQLQAIDQEEASVDAGDASVDANEDAGLDAGGWPCVDGGCAGPYLCYYSSGEGCGSPGFCGVLPPANAKWGIACGCAGRSVSQISPAVFPPNHPPSGGCARVPIEYPGPCEPDAEALDAR